MSALNKNSSIHQKDAKTPPNNFNSRRSNANNVRDQMYQITTFEEEMDRETKKRNKFDIKRYKNNQNRIHNFSDYIREAAQTPRNTRPINISGNLQNSLVVQAGGFQNMNHSTGMNLNPAMPGPNNAQRKFNPVSQSYQGAEMAGILSGMNKDPAMNLNADGLNARLDQSNSNMGQPKNIMNSMTNAGGASRAT